MIINGTCGMCEHWKEVEDVRGVGQCTKIKMADSWEDYEIDEDNVIKTYIRDDIAHVVDGSDYFAALRTKETFGCNLYEPKEK